MKRIVNVTLTLAPCNLDFSRICRDLGTANSGNFLAITELLVGYDPVLKDLIMKPQGSIKYFSLAVQNELIYIIEQRVKQDIQHK